MEKYTIGIDFGTLSGRAVLVRVSDGREIASAALDYKSGVMDDRLPASGRKLGDDFALEDPRDYIEVLQTVIPAVIRESGIGKEAIIGIGIDFTTCTLLPLGEDYLPLSMKPEFAQNPHAYVKLWKHHAAQSYADRLNETALGRNEGFLPRFGNKISSEFLFPKLWEILDKAPEVYEKTHVFTEAGDYIAYLLTGNLPYGHSFAAYKGQYIEGIGWPSEDFLASLDERLRHVVSEKLMVDGRKLYFPSETVGRVTREAAERFGLPEGIPVACPLPDAHVASPGMRQSDCGDMFAILGTSSCFMLIGDKEVTVPGTCGVVKHGLLPDFYGFESGLCCAGDLYAWVSHYMVSPEYVQESEERGIPMLPLLVEKAAKQKPGEHGLLALNWWNGNRNPLVDANLSGMLIGMTLQTRPEDILRAAIEATAFGTRLLIEHYRSFGVEVKTFRAGGGIARKDPFTMQLYADVLNMEIPVADSRQIPALSSAIYAAVAAGEAGGGYASIREATEKMGSPFSRVYTPNPEAVPVYDRLYKEYVTLFDYFGRGGNEIMKRLKGE